MIPSFLLEIANIYLLLIDCYFFAVVPEHRPQELSTTGDLQNAIDPDPEVTLLNRAKEGIVLMANQKVGLNLQRASVKKDPGPKVLKPRRRTDDQEVAALEKDQEANLPKRKRTKKMTVQVDDLEKILPGQTQVTRGKVKTTTEGQ